MCMFMVGQGGRGWTSRLGFCTQECKAARAAGQMGWEERGASICTLVPGGYLGKDLVKMILL